MTIHGEAAMNQTIDKPKLIITQSQGGRGVLKMKGSNNIKY